MAHTPTTPGSSVSRLSERKSRVAAVREHAGWLLEQGTSGTEIAVTLARETERLLDELYQTALDGLAAPRREALGRDAAMIAVGGTGRGEASPFSDVDLLFLYRDRRDVGRWFGELVGQVVRDCWDAGLQVGHSLRTIPETIDMARQDAQVATSLVEARLLCGDERLFERLRSKIGQGLVRGRLRTFIESCLAARGQEQFQHGATVQRLEPDIKRSLGGLRDVHLIRWIGFARYGTPDLESLHEQGGLNDDDAGRLRAAQEFLTRVRIDLHLAAGRAQDVLTRDEQLRIAARRDIVPIAGLRRVECFMQEYFRHSMAIAEIARRFVARHRPKTIQARVTDSVISHRVNNVFRVGRDAIDVLPRHREAVGRSLEQVLRLYHSSLLYGVGLAPDLVEQIKQAVPQLDGELSPACCRVFLEILRGGGPLGIVLRNMYDVGLLELLVPPMRHARCLLQFNQYHSYTVDEHTLRAVEAAEELQHDDGPVGTACRAIHHKEILHLALLLHDLGKGYEEDHSEVGRRIADEVARRLRLSDRDRDTLVFLVHKHLLMSHLAFRRDLSDPAVLMELAHQVGSPETLRMLYVLTAADLIAVGPNVWTDWKADLLTELFDGTMLILTGKQFQFHEAERVRLVREQVHELYVGMAKATSPPLKANSSPPLTKGGQGGLVSNPAVAINAQGPCLTPPSPPLARGGDARESARGGDAGESAGARKALAPATPPAPPPHHSDGPGGPSYDAGPDWLDRQLDAFPPHYLTATPPERIVADLQVIRDLGPGGIVIEGENVPETGTVEYRVLTHADLSEGCFHKIAGALTANRLEILAAQISTSLDGTVVDSFRVLDGDYAADVPRERIDEVADSIRTALTGETTVERLFQRHRRFTARRQPPPTSNLPMRVTIDNDTSDRCTIIDVFAHDRTGLLYTITRTLYELGLSVVLAKIATHLDQVVDVFYVTDAAGEKLTDPDRLAALHAALTARIEHFEQQGHREFVS